MIDDFEVDNPPGTNGWEPFWDEATPTSMHCTAEEGMAHAGARSLLLDFEVTPGAWATCALFYDNLQNWSSADGLAFSLHADQAGLVFNVDLYAGGHDAQETYVYTIEAPPGSADGWVPITLRWSDFHRADWEENGGAPFAKPDQVVGLAFGFDTYEDTPNTGTLWVDDLTLLGSTPAVVEQPPEAGAEPSEEPSDAPPAQPTFRRMLPCSTALIFPLGLVGLAVLMKRWRRGKITN
jgi:hypothetical protein